MANTYTQIHLQFVFAVKFRTGMIAESWEDELFKYITGIVQNQKHKMLAINGMSDHVHLLVGKRPFQSESDLMQDIKSGSSKWINDKKFCKARFEWQDGYGCFSYSKKELPGVISYIQNQKEHHRQKTFTEEYLELLEEFGIEFDTRYTFKTPE
jgi:putative transposase